MDLIQAMSDRHAVRSYSDKPIEGEVLAALEASIARANQEGDLHMQLITDEPLAFEGGHFSGVTSYIVVAGRKSADLEERAGYYGEQVVLESQTLGLNTCWVYMTYRRQPERYNILEGEKLVIVITVGYGTTQGEPHASKDASKVSNTGTDTPDWFRAGVEAALLAPTAVNQQKFSFRYDSGSVRARAGIGFCTKIDLGIAKRHFELGAGRPVAWE